MLVSSENKFYPVKAYDTQCLFVILWSPSLKSKHVCAPQRHLSLPQALYRVYVFHRTNVISSSEGIFEERDPEYNL